MKIIEAKDMTDEQWIAFAKFDDFLMKEIYPQFWDGKNSDWEELKKKTMESLKLSEVSFSNYYYFFEDRNAIAQIEAFERKDRLYFVFDQFSKIVSPDIIKIILDRIYELMIERNKNESFFHTYYSRHYEPLLKLGAEVFDEALTSKLLKEDIDFKNLEKIVESNKFAKSYELKLFHEIPEEIIDRFLVYSNEVSFDSKLNHPKGKNTTEFTLNDILAMIQERKADKDPFYMYMLFDDENIAAYCSVNIETIDGKHVIEHRGGLTSVGRNYRGKNLAKYLKAKMYLKIQEDFPDFEYILTDTYPWNIYMYRINEEFGFKPFQKGYTFRFTKEFL